MPTGVCALSEQRERVEVSGGLRRAGLTIDAEYQRIAARADDRLPLRGLFMAGRADLDKASLEAGYMLVAGRLEIAGAVDQLDTLAFEKPWRRAAVGMNWYVNRHALKFSVLHRESCNDAASTTSGHGPPTFNPISLRAVNTHTSWSRPLTSHADGVRPAAREPAGFAEMGLAKALYASVAASGFDLYPPTCSSRGPLLRLDWSARPRATAPSTRCSPRCGTLRHLRAPRSRLDEPDLIGYVEITKRAPAWTAD